MMINTDIIINNATINGDFLNLLYKDQLKPILKFSRYNIPNRRFIELICEKKYFIVPYVLLGSEEAVNNILSEINWCSENFRGRFSVKYVTESKNNSLPDRLVIAFENEEDQILFLLRSDIANKSQIV